MNIKNALKIGNNILKENNIQESSLKTKMILSNILNTTKEFLIIYENFMLSEEQENKYFYFIKRLLNNEPIQYILNKQEFMGLNFYVDENVLIPQPDTEILVEEAISIINSTKKNIKILDLCTGSGAIAIALYKNLKNKENTVYASDISEKALNIAKKNCNNNCANVIFLKSDIFLNMMGYKFDIIVSNPPYIETEVIKKLSEEVKKEPILALDGGKDGLKFYRKIICEAKKYLNLDGYLALEIGYNQKEAVKKILTNYKYKNIYSKKDLGNNDRVIIAQI